MKNSQAAYRFALLAGALGLLLLSAMGFLASYLSVRLPERIRPLYGPGVDGTLVLQTVRTEPGGTVLLRDNGLNLELGLFAFGLFLLSINAAGRDATGDRAGPVDRLLLRRPERVGAALMIGLLLLMYRPLVAAFSHPVGSLSELSGGGLTVVHGVQFFPPWSLLACAALAAWIAIAGLAGSATSTPLALGSLCVAALVYQCKDVRFHGSAADAVAAFEGEHMSFFQTAGPLLFGATGQDDQTIHMAAVTPDLVRELDRQGREVLAPKEDELPMPGLLPLVLLLATAVTGWWRQRRMLPGQSDAFEWTPVVFGTVNLYMVLWFVAVTHGVLTPVSADPNDPPSPWALVLGIGLLALTAVPFSWMLCLRMQRSPSAPSALASRWGAVFYLVHLAAVGGVFLVSEHTPGSPVGLWLLTYIGLGTLCWRASVSPARTA